MREVPLSKLQPGQSGRVSRLESAAASRLRLLEMGLVRGTPVEFVRVAPLGDPLEIRVRSYHLALRRQEAESIILDCDAP